MLIARKNRIDRRVLPCAHAFETQFVLVIGKRPRNVRAKELRRNASYHSPSLLQSSAPGALTRNPGRTSQSVKSLHSFHQVQIGQKTSMAIYVGLAVGSDQNRGNKTYSSRI